MKTKELFLTHLEFSNFRKLMHKRLCYDIAETNTDGVVVVFEDTADNRELVKEIGYE